MKRRTAFFALVSITALSALSLISGCKKGVDHPAADSVALQVAPAWRLKNLEGREVTLSQFRGKVVIVDFWATWCAPCRAEMPAYVALQKQFAEKGLVIVGISLDGQGPAVVKKFTDSLAITYPIVMGDSDVTEAYEVKLMPTTFIIDRQGKIRHRKEGSIADQAEYEKLVASFL